MRGLFKNKPLIIMLVAVLLLGVLAFITSADRSVSWVESTLGSVFQPVQTFAAKASNSIIGFFQRIFKTPIRSWSSFRCAWRSLSRRRTKTQR